MYAAFDALSDGLKSTLEGLHALHFSRHVFGIEAKRLHSSDLKGRHENPNWRRRTRSIVVITHPGSGRNALSPSIRLHLRFTG